MKKSFILVFLAFQLFFPKISDCQDYKYPKIQKICQPNQEYGKPIIYQFPDMVNMLIYDYVQKEQDSISFFNIELDAKDNGYTIILRNTNTTVLYDTNNSQGLLLSSCYRFCKIGNRNIPIYLRSDKEFGFYNFVITGEELVINIKRKRNYIFEIIEYHVNK